jgi:uncharacterized tellurite resistance protein B-like protein
MIRTIREFFEARIVVTNDAVPEKHSLELATAALLIEVSRADFDVGVSERTAIEEAVRNSFGLDASETNEIIALAEAEVERAISLYEFTQLVDQNFSPAQKEHIVGLLWDVALSDDRLEGREEHLIRKVATLLHVPHERFIAGKIAARKRREERRRN